MTMKYLVTVLMLLLPIPASETEYPKELRGEWWSNHKWGSGDEKFYTKCGGEGGISIKRTQHIFRGEEGYICYPLKVRKVKDLPVWLIREKCLTESGTGYGIANYRLLDGKL